MNFFNKKRSIKFLIFLILFALILSILIYWRENEVQDQISFYNVLLWQVGIWIPWALIFLVFKKIVYKSGLQNSKIRGLGILWIGIHYVWFFYLSSQFSPYLGMPATRYGVYPYFFIFWTIMDIVLIWNILNILTRQKLILNDTSPIKFKLSRGNRTFYCDLKQIFWLSSEGYYTSFHTEQGIFLIRKSLKNILKELPQSDFKRVHRSTVININYVSGFGKTKNNGLEVILKDGSRRSVSRNYSKEIRAFFKSRSI
ncbi:MAG: hypothetical protein DRI75_13040 [Bacteroidetes bacterium]|nr:MAG: hypothetical protein DRI75_13040 [Bacteroidota bacterium]